MKRQIPFEPVTTEFKPVSPRPDPAADSLAEAFSHVNCDTNARGELVMTNPTEFPVVTIDPHPSFPPGSVGMVERTGEFVRVEWAPTPYNWQSHPIRYGLHEMGKLAASVRWNFPPLRPYGVTRERP